MKAVHPGETASVWVETLSMPPFSPLEKHLSADVCIIGGGIGGITTAYMLAKEGKKVCVLEAFEVGSGQTGKTTAHFANALDDRFTEIEKLFGTAGMKLAVESHTAALNKVEEIVAAENVDCDLQRVDGYLFAAEDPRPHLLERELEAIHRAEMWDVELLPNSPLKSFETGPCLRFPNQIQLHPLKYLRGMISGIIRAGGQVFTHSRVTKVTGGTPARVELQNGVYVGCDAVVVATNSPINDLFTIHTKQAPYRTYALGFRIPQHSLPKGLYWDTLDPYHYVRSMPGSAHFSPAEIPYDILIVGGEDHKTGQDADPAQHFAALEEWARRRFPFAQQILHRWSGQVMEPVDGLGFLGHNPLDKNNVYVITGDSGHGMTHCTIGAMLITDQIMGRDNPWEQIYNPSRVTLRAASTFLQENVNVAAQYAEWFAMMRKPKARDIPLGEGVVYREGFSMIAAYKDESGEITRLSAVCPHLAGIVKWNLVEKSWDCPCHGSRFDCHGKVIEGPAFTDLALAEEPADAVPLRHAFASEPLVPQP